MEKTADLKYFEQIVGKLALNNGDFIIVHKIDTKVRKKKEKIGGGYFNPKYKHFEVLDAETIWWEVVGDNSGKVYTNNMSTYYEWEQMIRDAAILIHQAEVYLNKKTNGKKK